MPLKGSTVSEWQRNTMAKFVQNLALHEVYCGLPLSPEEHLLHQLECGVTGGVPVETYDHLIAKYKNGAVVDYVIQLEQLRERLISQYNALSDWLSESDLTLGDCHLECERGFLMLYKRDMTCQAKKHT